MSLVSLVSLVSLLSLGLLAVGDDTLCFAGKVLEADFAGAVKCHEVRLKIVLVLVYDKFARRKANLRRYCHFLDRLLYLQLQCSTVKMEIDFNAL